MAIVPHWYRYRNAVLNFWHRRATLLTGDNMRLYGLIITVFIAWAMFHALGIDISTLLR